jgi:hypothetical protein
VPRHGDEGEELGQFLVSLESVTAQLVHRADRVGTGSAPDQFLQRDQIFAASLALMFSTRAHRTYLMIVQLSPRPQGIDARNQRFRCQKRDHKKRYAVLVAVRLSPPLLVYSRNLFNLRVQVFTFGGDLRERMLVAGVATG